MANVSIDRCSTYEFKIFVSGDYDRIKEVCQKFCLQGFCVSVKKVDYLYTMGAEGGAEVTVLNYPRFPSTEGELLAKSVELGEEITLRCHQGSFTVVGPSETTFWSRRDGDKV